MNGTVDGAQPDRRRHDRAYLCFLPPGLVYLIAGIASLVPLDSGEAGGIGFLVLIPLSLLSLVAVPVGIYYTLSFRRDWILLFLAIATILMLVQLFAEVGPVRLRNLLGLVYGIAVVVGAGSWFLYRRKRS